MAANRDNGILLQFVLDELTRMPPMSDHSDLDLSNTIITAHEEAFTKRNNSLLGTVRIENYVEDIVPRYSAPLFKAHFRMTPSSVESLLELIGPHIALRTISLERRTLACLWYVSNQETFRSVADRFGMSKGSLHFYLNIFCKTLTGPQILPQLIHWPKPEEYAVVAERNAVRVGFPGVIGMLDGSYIPIPGPSAFRDSYICRKGFPAMHLQGVCDSTLKFTDVYCAYPGSAHDSRVYRNSPLAEYLEKKPLSKEYHLLGDSAYSLSSTVIVPFRDNGHMTTIEKRFNSAHSSTRVDIERCFGLLKGKFRKLKFLDMRNVKDIPSLIVTCCVLHNFILAHESYTDSEIDVDKHLSAISLKKKRTNQDFRRDWTLPNFWPKLVSKFEY